jgi:DNA replication and repair protein RecF
VLFEPNDLLLLSGSPDLRRSFLDDLIEQTVPGYGATRRHYKRVLAQRNALLKQPGRNFDEQLFVWNLRLSELGGKVVRERVALAERFAVRISELYCRLADKTNDVSLAYVAQFPVEHYETVLLHRLEAAAELDRARGFTGSGPHRDDLRLLIDGHEASISASRGETRTLVLALKLLELQLLEEIRGSRPLLLLDDVFSELDGKRRQALVAFVASYQTFITTTDADIVVQYFTGGNIIPMR